MLKLKLILRKRLNNNTLYFKYIMKVKFQDHFRCNNFNLIMPPDLEVVQDFYAVFK